ncbi:hypothetical protein HOY82DRAFT_649283 [Tuber indicum]|nr:hypothetical protein HOY82DRAFT_649283 [Tuber indicum]
MNIEASFPGNGFRPGGLQPFLKSPEALRWNWFLAGGDMVLFSNSARESGLALPNVKLFKVTDKLFTNHRSRDPRLQYWDRLLRLGIAGWCDLWAWHFNGKDFGTVNRRFFVGNGSDIDGTPINLVSHLVSEKACGGSEFFFTNFKEGFGKGRWVDIRALDIPLVHIGAQSVLPSYSSDAGLNIPTVAAAPTANPWILGGLPAFPPITADSSETNNRVGHRLQTPSHPYRPRI